MGAEVAVESNRNASQNQNNSMILLGGKSLFSDLSMEKSNLDTSFVHSHRLLDLGMYSVRDGAGFLINAHLHTKPCCATDRDCQGEAQHW